ncbi:SIR2 family protein [Candidatus Latescibacterota bacterium]
MSKQNVFPDQNHIEQIRKCLWNGREFGQASVMIGTGFSRNAGRISSSTPPFPLWSELAKNIYSSLNPLEQNNKKQIHPVEAIKLANEYEVYYSRQALDDLLLQSIPDKNYFPSWLHTLLLSLPWSDVFTTNYDTLLERTQPSVHDRKYDLVLTASDIPGRMKPRIAKLHGSFPSHRPFIITEEDYRTYPTKFAPFVNMVQQSIMENTLCLIGFSGDDPNFLYWSGWVRDNLGSAAPPIYLCGLLNLSPSQRQLLKNRNIIPIDLSPMFPESVWPVNDVRFSKAIEWFLLILMNGAPPNNMSWPVPAGGSIWKPSDDLPNIISGPKPLSDLGKIQPNTGPLKTDDLKKVYETWRSKRLEYPGWVIAHKDKRDTIWRYTEYWIEPVLNSIDNLSPPENLFLLYELNWRLEITLTPLFMKWVEKITQILELFNPFPKLINMKNSTVKPDKNENKELNWKWICEYWVELAFALAREAREDQDEKRFRLWMDRLEKVLKQSPEWEVRWFYEESLFYLFHFDQYRIRKTLENWPVTNDLPFWEIKRASILAELGELKEAEKIVEEALSLIRTRLKPYSPDYSLLSQEGWAMMLLKSIKDNKWGVPRDFIGNYRDRWEKLGNYQCNPWPEIELLGSIVKQPSPSPIPRKEIKKEFDLKRTKVTHHFSSGYNFSAYLPAFAFLRMLEEGALPIKCGAVSMFLDSVLNSAKWIEPFAPRWSLCSMIRTGKEKEIKEWFNRVRIASLEQDEVDYWTQVLMNSILQAIKDLNNNPQQIGLLVASFSQRQVIILSELLSRLCIRFTNEELNKLFNFITDMYKNPLFSQYHFFHDCVKVFFNEILNTMPQSEIFKRIPELLSLPIPTESGFVVKLAQQWIEPFNYIECLDGTRLSPDFDRSEWSSPIENLLSIIKKGTPEARIRAIIRLVKLYYIGGLTKNEKKTFGEALWSRIDPEKGLPSDTGLYDFSFLSLPEINKGTAKRNFRKTLLSMDFPRKSHFRFPLDKRHMQEWLGSTAPLFSSKVDKSWFVDWSSDEVIQLLKKAVSWWDDEKEELEDRNINIFLDITDTLREQFSFLVELMAIIILPKLANADEEIKSLAKRLLLEMDQKDINILNASPILLLIDPTLYNEIAIKFRKSLISIKKEEIRDSIKGLYYWLVYSNRKRIPKPPKDLLNELINRVVTRRQPGLDSAIGQLGVIIKRMPNLLNKIQFESLYIALEYLITETEIHKKMLLETTSVQSLAISIPDRPIYRELVAELAYRLFINLSNNNKIIPEILIKWKNICQNDPLPEVRKVWREGD